MFFVVSWSLLVGLKGLSYWFLFTLKSKCNIFVIFACTVGRLYKGIQGCL
jgi:hypothetical protein